MTTRGNYCIPVAHVRARSPQEFLEKKDSSRKMQAIVQKMYTRVHEAIFCETVVIINTGIDDDLHRGCVDEINFLSLFSCDRCIDASWRSCIVEERIWKNFDAEVKKNEIFEDRVPPRRVAVVEGKGWM